MNDWLGLIISCVLGFLCVNILRARNRIDLPLLWITSIGIGISLSGHVVFYTLFTVGKYSHAFIWTVHAILFLVLCAANWNAFQKSKEPILPPLPTDKNLWIGIAVISLLLLPLWREANFYPFGGWDAWACWNLKSKFILLGGEHWKNMFDPVMWRSNNQYPFLLSLINAWGWSFSKTPSTTIPLISTILFTLLTAMLMFVSLYRLTKKIVSIIPPLVLFTVPFVNTLSISQYSDIVLAFYLLGSFVFLVAAREEKNIGFAVLAGCFCGILSFTKTEGTLASVLVAGLSVPYLWNHKDARSLLWPFGGALAACSLPTLLFQMFWAPGNESFVNGLTSVDTPATFLRLKIILMFLFAELVSIKWNELWIILVCGLLLSKTRGFKNALWIVPAFLTLYLGAALAYYFINTHFEIIWWLQTTLNRVLYSILPIIVWWVFHSLWSPAAKK